jgi:oxygen-independent coproporphyrinogen-3 oxidase
LGWEQYEISNFSKPGFNCLHNLKYWKYQAFLGLGPSASSHLGSFRWSNCNHLSAWLASLKSPGSIFSEFIYLEPEVAIREVLASGLRLKEGINWDELKQAYPEFNFSVYQEKIRQLEAEGLLKYENSYLSIPADKLLISNSIIADLIF